MAIDKFQIRHFSQGRVYLSPINILKHSFSETSRPIELKFHMETPFDRFAKIYTNCFDHMTKIATTPIYGVNPLNLIL